MGPTHQIESQHHRSFDCLHEIGIDRRIHHPIRESGPPPIENFSADGIGKDGLSGYQRFAQDLLGRPGIESGVEPVEATTFLPSRTAKMRSVGVILVSQRIPTLDWESELLNRSKIRVPSTAVSP